MLVVRGGHELVGGVVEDELGGGRDDATVVAAGVGDDERIGPVVSVGKDQKNFHTSTGRPFSLLKTSVHKMF